MTSLIYWSAAAVLFEYTNHTFLSSSLLQAAGVFLALAIAYFFFEHRSQARQKKIDVTVHWSIDRLRSLAKAGIIEVVQQWVQHPSRRNLYGSSNNRPTYEQARTFVLERPGFLTGYKNETNYFRTLNWVFKRFDELGSACDQSFRTIGPGLMEYGALIRAMSNLEHYVETEKRVWEEFRIRMSDRYSPLPGEANYNLLAIAELAIRLVDVIDSKDLKGDPEY